MRQVPSPAAHCAVRSPQRRKPLPVAISRSLPQRLFSVPGNHGPALVAALVLAILTVWLWSPALHFGFIYDDHLQIESNAALRSWSNFGHLLREPLWSQLGPDKAAPYYRPLFSCFLLVNSMLLGPNPELWHLVSLVLHVLVVLSLFAFLFLHFRRWLPAFAGAGLFACSPLTAEVVNWVSASDEALYTLLILVSLCALLLSARGESARPALLLRIVSIIALGLACFAKETGAVGVPLVVTYEYLFLSDRRQRRTLWFYSPTLLVLLVFFYAHPSLSSPESRAPGHVIVAMGYAAVLAFRKMVWPVPVAQFYELWFDQPHSAGSLALHFAALAAVLSALVFAALRARFAAWACMVLVLPLAADIASIPFLRDYDYFHDRYLYLPLAGAAMLIGAAVSWAGENKRRMIPLLAVLALAGGGEIWLARWVSQQFSSDLPFFSHAVQTAPDNIVAWQFLADSEMQMGDCGTAIASEQRAEDLRPDLWKTRFYLGIADFRCDRPAAAAGLFAEAAVLPRTTAEQTALAFYELARVRLTQGDAAAARIALQQAAMRDPASHKVRALLAQMSSSN